MIAALIGIMIAIVVGVSLIPSILKGVEVTTEEVPEGSAVGALMQVLPIVFVTVIILGAIAWIGGITGTGVGIRISIGGMNPVGFVPSGPFLKYNLARQTARLRVTTEELNKDIGITVMVTDDLDDFESPLQLLDGRGFLHISSSFGWYTVEKHPKYPMYKVVGIHKWQRRLNCVHLLGRDSNTNQPFLHRLPPEYIRRPMIEGVRWCIDMDRFDTLIEV